MATKYQQGRDTEYMAIRRLEDDGNYATRSAGSHKVADVIAWNQHRTRFIQCKRYTTRPGSFRKDIEQLAALPLPPDATAELWVRQHGHPGWLIRALIAERIGGIVEIRDLDAIEHEITTAAKELRWKTRAKKAPTSTPRRTPRNPRSSSTCRATRTSRASGATAPPSEPDPATHA